MKSLFNPFVRSAGVHGGGAPTDSLCVLINLMFFFISLGTGSNLESRFLGGTGTGSENSGATQA